MQVRIYIRVNIKNTTQLLVVNSYSALPFTVKSLLPVSGVFTIVSLPSTGVLPFSADFFNGNLQRRHAQVWFQLRDGSVREYGNPEGGEPQFPSMDFPMGALRRA